MRCSGNKFIFFFVVNDAFYPVNEPNNNTLPKGVIIGSLKEIATHNPELLKDITGNKYPQKRWYHCSLRSFCPGWVLHVRSEGSRVG